jgi:DNA-binding NarL/FixJ family response regulator
MINIILVSKNQLFRQALKIYLEKGKLSNSVTHYSFFEELQQNEQMPDIVIAELASEVGKFKSIEALLGSFPKVKVLLIANNLHIDEYQQMIDLGVKGTVCIGADLEELTIAVKELAAGKIYFPYDVLRQVMTNTQNDPGKLTGLTYREIEILRLLCDGLSNEQISEKLHLSFDTIKWHRSNILNKCECKNILALYKYAVKHKLIPATKVH